MSTWCSKHVGAWTKLIVKQKNCVSSWLITKTNEGQGPYNSHVFFSGASRTKFRAPSSPTQMLHAAKQNTKFSHPLLFAVVSFHNPRKKRKSANKFSPPPPLQKRFAILMFLFYLQKHRVGSCMLFPLHLVEHHAVWFEDLLELSNSFRAPIHLRVPVIYFYAMGDRSRKFAKPPSTNPHNARDECMDFLRAPCSFTLQPPPKKTVLRMADYPCTRWHTIQNPALNGDLPLDVQIAATFVLVVWNLTKVRQILRDETVSWKIVNCAKQMGQLQKSVVDGDILSCSL